MALTTSKTYYRQGFAPLMPSVTVAPYPYCLHCKARACAPDGGDWYKACPPSCPLKVVLCYQALETASGAATRDIMLDAALLHQAAEGDSSSY